MVCQTGAMSALTDLVASGSPIDVMSPLTGDLLHRLPQSTRSDVESAFERARFAQRAWARAGFAYRREALLRAHDLIVERAENLIAVIRSETGKTYGQALEEILGAAGPTRYSALAAHSVLRGRFRASGLPFLVRTQVKNRPKGVVGIITPWNYPLALAAMDAAPALAAGNAVVMKTDNQGARSVLEVRRCFIDAGVPEHVWSVVSGSGDVAGEAVTDLADYICFTGSTPTGRKVGEKAGRRLVGASLELGGKNAVIVTSDVDPATAAKDVAYAAFSSMGQLCVSVERIYVDARVSNAFTRELVQHLSSAELGTGENADFGSLVGPSQLERVNTHLSDALSKGARVLVGGAHRPEMGPFVFEPTVLTGVTRDMLAYSEETFGAMVSLYEYEHLSDAVTAANDSEFGLNAAVLCRDITVARGIAEELEAGTININEGYRASFGSAAAPMGGAKASGLGRRNGPEGLRRFVEPVTISWTTGLLKLPVTAEDFARLGPLMLLLMRVLRALRMR